MVNHPKGCFGKLMLVFVAVLRCGCRKWGFLFASFCFSALFFVRMSRVICLSVPSDIFLSQIQRRDGNVLHSQSSCPSRKREAKLPSAYSVPVESSLSCCFLGSEAGRGVRWEGTNPQGINLEFHSSCNNCCASEAHNSQSLTGQI